MKLLPHLLCISLLAWGGIATPPATAATLDPYTAWANDYTGSEAHTLGLWKFDNPTPSADSSSGERSLTISSNGTQTGVAGKFGEAFLSRGTGPEPGRSTDNNSHFTISDSVGLFNTSALSVEFWFSPIADRPTGTESYSYFFDKKYTSDTGFQLRLSNNGTAENRLLFTVGNGSASTSASSPDLTWTANAWYHIAVTYEAVAVYEDDLLIRTDGLLKIFRNGELVGSSTVNNFGELAVGTRGWRIANRIGSAYGSVPGYYDNFRISDVAYAFAPIPEPATALLLGPLLPLAWLARRSRR